jgi:putative glutamine amidotransferase
VKEAGQNRPLIGVTGDDQRLRFSWWFIRWALWRSGAQAHLMTPNHPHPPEGMQAVIISGGDDIDPQLYRPDAPDVAPINPRRDQFELQVINTALEQNLPILGICRGAQLLNVVLGGTLFADLREVRLITSNRRTLLPLKTLLLKENSQLNQVLQTRRCRINSLHHQAIRELGEGLVVSAWDADEIVQAVECPAHPFRIGVQWHPEYLPLSPHSGRLFRRLSDEARQC